jgi:cytochrome b
VIGNVRPSKDDAMAEEMSIKVWDIAVRVFHWSLVVFFFVAYFSGDEESALHVYTGYGVLALVAFRIVWGLVGTKHARFADFIFGPAATLQYVRSLASSKPLHYLGHNPLAGWMVVALLVCLLGACWSGLKAYGEQGHGPLAKYETWAVPTAMANDHEREQRSKRVRKERRTKGEEFWKEIHEALSNLTLFLVFLHVVGGLMSSGLHRENLIKAMITGYKTRRAP